MADHLTKISEIEVTKNTAVFYFKIAKKCFKKDGIWVCHYAAKG